MRHNKLRLAWVALLVLGAGMACQLTSPRPASWARTPTAEARETEIALTQAAIQGVGEFVFTPTVPNPTPEATQTPTPTPEADGSGPWLVYPVPDGSGLYAYDISARQTVTINLPGPIIVEDLLRGRSPDGKLLMVRAGSALSTDELALYQIDLPTFEISTVTPLLSLTVQRKIVNDQGTLVLNTLATVTRPDGLAWSPDGRFLAFNAALHNETSDLYVYDTLNNRVDRLNGMFSHNASPVWSPGGIWLITQELEYVQRLESWRAELVSGLRVPTFDSQNTIYLPLAESTEEVIVGWLNPYTFVSYSLTSDGPRMLRQVDVEELDERMIFEGDFQQVAFDPSSGVLAFILSYDDAIPLGLSGGIYRLLPDSSAYQLQQVGNWDRLVLDSSGKFVAGGSQGVTLFTPQGDSFILPDQGNANLSPNGNWLIAWDDGHSSDPGARLYQSASSSPLQTLTEEPVETLFWQPDSMGFFILSEGVLSHFVFPGLRPSEIVSGLPHGTGLTFLWVE